MGYPRFVLGNTVSAAIANEKELIPNFSFSDYTATGFNDNFYPEFICTGGLDDGVNFIDAHEQAGKFYNKIKCDFQDNGLTVPGFIKLGDAGNTFTTNPKIYKLKWERADATFEEAANGILLKAFLEESDFVSTRYVRRSVPNYLETVMIASVLYLMVIQAIEQFKRTLEAVIKAVPRSATDLGVAVVLILDALLQIAIFASIVLAAGALLKSMSDALFAKPKRLFALDVLSTMQKGCEALGFEFKSTLLESKTFEGLTFLASTTTGGSVLHKPKNDPIPDISFMDWITKFLLVFNLKPRVANKVFTIDDAKSYENNPIDVKLNDLYNTGDTKYNNFEIPRGITVKYQVNGSEQHVKEDKAEIAYTVNDTNVDVELEKVLKVNLPFSRGVRKNEQDFGEALFNTIFDSLAGLNKNYKVIAGDRIGYLLLNSDVVPMDMIYIRDGEKLKKETDLQASNLLLNYYQIEGPDENQWALVEGRDADPLCTQNQATQLIVNNVCFNSSGRKILVQKNEYNTVEGAYELGYKMRLQAGDFGHVDPKFITKELTYTVGGNTVTETI